MKGSGRIIKRRGKALRCGSMGVSIMGSLRVGRKMGRGFLGGKMGLSIQVNLKKTIFTGKESTNGPITDSTTANGITIKDTDTVFSYLQMAKGMKVITNLIRGKGMVC
jgi:hypothetical protein